MGECKGIKGVGREHGALQRSSSGAHAGTYAVGAGSNRHAERGAGCIISEYKSRCRRQHSVILEHCHPAAIWCAACFVRAHTRYYEIAATDDRLP